MKMAYQPAIINTTGPSRSVRLKFNSHNKNNKNKNNNIFNNNNSTKT